MSESDDILRRGLEAGYAGKAKPKRELRGTFPVKVLTSVEHEGLDKGRGVYRDEWTAGRSGGGQELAWSLIDNFGSTRVYAGGVAHEDILHKLHATEDEVIEHLKYFVENSHGRTRMHTPYSAQYLDWQYDYEVMRRLSQNVNLTVGLETVRLKRELVFAHGFVIAPLDQI